MLTYSVKQWIDTVIPDIIPPKIFAASSVATEFNKMMLAALWKKNKKDATVIVSCMTNEIALRQTFLFRGVGKSSF